MAITQSIQVTPRDDLSLLYRLLRTFIRPFRPRLASPGKPIPAGSPKLSPPSTKCTVRERLSGGLYLYDFMADSSSCTTTEETRLSKIHHLFYFAGGGFQSPTSDHWKFCTALCMQLVNVYHIILVSYPLAPNSPAPQSLPMLHKWLRSTAADAAVNDYGVTLMGDSSGGNIALSLGFWWASNVLDPTARSTLKNLFAICPATDLRNENPDIAECARHDPVLTVKMSSDVGKAWAGSLPLDNPEVSPIFSNPDLLRQSGIKVHGVVGTHDILAPDAIKFREACRDAGVAGEWLQWKGQMHCFPFTFAYGLKEGRESKDWIVDVLRRNV